MPVQEQGRVWGRAARLGRRSDFGKPAGFSRCHWALQAHVALWDCFISPVLLVNSPLPFFFTALYASPKTWFEGPPWSGPCLPVQSHLSPNSSSHSQLYWTIFSLSPTPLRGDYTDEGQTVYDNRSLTHNLYSTRPRWSGLGQWLWAALFFASTSNSGPARERQICPPIQSPECLKLPCQSEHIWSLFTTKPAVFSLCLWASAECDGGDPCAVWSSE